MTMFKSSENLLTTIRDGINKLVYGKQVVGQETLVLSTTGVSGGLGIIQLSTIPPNATSAEITSLWYNTSNSVILQANAVRYFYELPFPSTANSAAYTLQSAVLGGGAFVSITTNTPHNYTTGQIVKMQGLASPGGGSGWEALNSIPFAIQVNNSTNFTTIVPTAPVGAGVVVGATVSLVNCSSSTSSSGVFTTAGSLVFAGGGVLRDNSPYNLIVNGRDNLKNIRFISRATDNRAISVVYYS